MELNTANPKDIKNVIKKMDHANPSKRLSILENEVDQMVRLYRDSLTTEIISQKQDEIAPPFNSPCSCGGKYEYKGKEKKT